MFNGGVDCQSEPLEVTAGELGVGYFATGVEMTDTLAVLAMPSIA